MLELYLISRIGVIHGFAVAIAIIFCIAAIGFLFCSIVNDEWTGEPCYSEWQRSMLRKYGKRCLIVFIVSTLVAILTPTKDEAYLIYGVGGTIDYLQSNDKAKQIPDKCIDALDKWVESLNKEKE